MALTFGTLLSSQGADALGLQPCGPSFEAICLPYTSLRSGRTSGSVRRFPRPCDPVRSRSVQGEQYTTYGALCRGVRGGGCLSVDAPLRRASVSVEPAVGRTPGRRGQRRPPCRASRRIRAPRRGAGGGWPAAGRRCPDVWGYATAPERLPHVSRSWVTACEQLPSRWTPRATDGVRPRHGVGTGR